MTKWVLQIAASRWREWTGHRPKQLHAALIASTRHEGHRFALIIADGWRRPSVVAKVAQRGVDQAEVESEFSTLRDAYEELPLRFRSQMPAPLIIEHLDSGCAMFTTAVRGARPVLPQLLGRRERLGVASLDSYLVASLAFARDLARATASDQGAADESLDEFSRLHGSHRLDALREHTQTARCWQHGDPAPGNVLMTRTGVRLIDWEHASPDHYPWHDAAYQALVLSLIAANQTDSSVTEAFDAMYLGSSWAGNLVRARVAEYWDSPVPMSEALAITAVDVAIRRQRSPVWGDLARHLLSRDQHWPHS